VSDSLQALESTDTPCRVAAASLGTLPGHHP
jgi:hypothetical protein